MEVCIPAPPSSSPPPSPPPLSSPSPFPSSSPLPFLFPPFTSPLPHSDIKDQSTNYLHWWPAKNTSEWVQYDFDKAYTISKSKVYWYDDKPWGGCDLPVSWKLLYKKGNEWVPVETTTSYEIAKDTYNTVEFQPVKTTGLRMVIQLTKTYAAGLQEWIGEGKGLRT